jgi:hypothetical protein
MCIHRRKADPLPESGVMPKEKQRGCVLQLLRGCVLELVNKEKHFKNFSNLDESMLYYLMKI